jgi:hypothetical protein
MSALASKQHLCFSLSQTNLYKWDTTPPSLAAPWR